MRSVLIGLILLVFLSVTILSLRPGGLRRQLRFAARRFRLALILGGIYLVATAIVRIAIPQGFVADWGPPLLAVALVITFMVLGQDPAAPPRPD